MKWILIGLSISVLSGCGTWHAGQSAHNDWYNVGFNEAQSGYSENWRSNYHMIQGGTPESFDNQAYSQGFQAGLEARCNKGTCAQSSTVADKE